MTGIIYAIRLCAKDGAFGAPERVIRALDLGGATQKTVRDSAPPVRAATVRERLGDVEDRAHLRAVE